jgi:hypothetical protein
MSGRGKGDKKKSMKTFVYDSGKRHASPAAAVEALVKVLDQIARRTDAAIAKARRAEEEFRELLSKV